MTSDDGAAPSVLHRLTVEGDNYLLAGSVDLLRAEILDAVRHGGGYVMVPGIERRGAGGVEILFSPGMLVAWTRVTVHTEADASGVPPVAFAHDDY